MGEYVAYPNGNPFDPDDPPFKKPDWNFINPTITTWDTNKVISGQGIDRHSPKAFSKPYKQCMFGASQKYRYRTPSMPPGEYKTLMDGINIVRSVGQKDGKWIYTIEKSGRSSTLELPP